jgi:hypothetical protein
VGGGQDGAEIRHIREALDPDDHLDRALGPVARQEALGRAAELVDDLGPAQPVGGIARG